MKFRTIEFFIVSAVVAFASAALLQSTSGSLQAFTNCTYVLLLAAIPIAIGRKGGERAFWMGFLITGVLYIAFALTPDTDGVSPRQYGSEFTTQFSNYAYDSLEGFCVDPDVQSDSVDRPIKDAEPNDSIDASTPSSDLNGDDDNPFGSGDHWDLESESLATGSLKPSSGNTSETEADQELNQALEENETQNLAVSGGKFGGGFSGTNDDNQNQFGTAGITEADFQPLIDLIRETVDTETWEDSDIVGTIEPYPLELCGGIIAHASIGRNYSNFMAISHCVWALFLGWLTGKASQIAWEFRAN